MMVYVGRDGETRKSKQTWLCEWNNQPGLAFESVFT